MALLDIVLSDKDGNPVLYSNVGQIQVPYYNNDGNLDVQRFTRLNWMNAYIVSSQDSGWTILHKLDFLAFPNSGYGLTAITDTLCQEMGTQNSSGDYSARILLTLKELTVGNTYTADEL